MGFEGAPTRRLDLRVWYPADASQRSDPATLASGGRFPLIIYSHGTFGAADNNMHLVEHLVRHGYIVAAPDYPLSSRAAFTHIKMADPSDVADDGVLLLPGSGPLREHAPDPSGLLEDNPRLELVENGMGRGESPPSFTLTR